MFDIDYFKTVNDHYGHIVGDKVLINLTKAVKSNLREGDIFFRYGGEEFVVVLPGFSSKDVTKSAEQIRHITEDMETRHQSQVLNITVSVDGASYPEHDAEKADGLLKDVDVTMYQAKESGRNMSMVD